MQSKRNLDQLILAIMVSTILANNVTHQFVISDNNGSTYFRQHPNNQGHISKRSECRYGDEDISGDGGLEANLCRSELGADPGVLNSDDDYDTIDIDISCHQDIWSHSGVYAQIYDKNHLGTILSASIAPYTNDKKGTLNKMPMCSNGLKHQCGRV